MKIAILCTSNDTSDFAKRHSTDDIKYVNLIQPRRPNWQLDCFAVWQNKFPDDIRDYNGIIITGSPASVLDSDPWIQDLLQLIRDAYQKEIPIFGGCFGHQAIAMAHGGMVGKNIQGGWSIGKEQTRFSKDAPFGLGNKSLDIYSIHKEEVTQLPENSISIGSNDYCKFPAFVMGDLVLTSQYHPEMTEEFLVDLTSELKGAIPDEQLAAAKTEFQSGHDGAQMIDAIINFFETAKQNS